jgi:two-component system, NarL family, sensor histidine kinase BarA
MAAEKANFGLKTKIIGLLSFVLLMLLIVDIAWTYESQKRATEAMLLEESRVLVTEMDAVWDFISINQDTINYTLEGAYEYKGLHCAIAGKSVAAFFSQNSDYTIRFTNITPRNIHNTPDAYESEALAQFAEHPGDPDREMYYGFAEYQGESVFRYVSAMKVTEHCIECHGAPQGELDPTGYEKEGWQTGDLAGAVSVIVPTQMYYENMAGAVVSNVLFFLAIMLCMATIIYVVLTRLITRPLEELRHSLADLSDGSPSGPSALPDKVAPVYASREIDELFAQFDAMASSLSSLYGNLESEVDERTMQLSAANEELERQRRHVEEVNDKLKRENQYKSDFLAIVSHELRTPLTSILAFTDLMADSVPRADELVRKQLEEIDKNGRILLEMVDNVLETARIQAGSERLNLELVDLSDVVGMVEASSLSLAAKKRIALATRVAGDVPLILSDWEKVRRILVNLVSNAIKFTPEEGSVSVDVRFDEGARLVVIEVTDDGIGIPADKQELIFERFAQENMSTVRRYGGSGLGLSLVKDLAAMLGGAVSLKSRVGEGSVFRVVLPADGGTEGEDE